jgi:transposase
LEERTLPYDEEAVELLLRGWPVVRCCYEAGPTGFGLQRFLVERGIDCQVVAPGLVPQRPGDRVKTDSRDARKLARLLAGGLLEAIHVPSRELEAARDLVRAREDARLDRMRDRHRLSKFCLRHGRALPTSSWTVARRKWLSEQRFEFAAQQQTFDSYVHTVDLVDARIQALERAIRETAEQEPWRRLVASLRCLRGIDTLTALALVAEIGDFDRFKSAEELMAFVGLVPSEHSSGDQRRQGSITKVGNSHVRRLLVESAWHARRRPTVGYQLARRQRGQDAIVVERAWRCQQRLYQRWQRMAGRGKPQQKIVVACARELAGFVWAIATEQPLRST